MTTEIQDLETTMKSWERRIETLRPLTRGLLIGTATLALALILRQRPWLPSWSFSSRAILHMTLPPSLFLAAAGITHLTTRKLMTQVAEAQKTIDERSNGLMKDILKDLDKSKKFLINIKIFTNRVDELKTHLQENNPSYFALAKLKKSLSLFILPSVQNISQDQEELVCWQKARLPLPEGAIEAIDNHINRVDTEGLFPFTLTYSKEKEPQIPAAPLPSLTPGWREKELFALCEEPMKKIAAQAGEKEAWSPEALEMLKQLLPSKEGLHMPGMWNHLLKEIEKTCGDSPLSFSLKNEIEPILSKIAEGIVPTYTFHELFSSFISSLQERKAMQEAAALQKQGAISTLLEEVDEEQPLRIHEPIQDTHSVASEEESSDVEAIDPHEKAKDVVSSTGSQQQSWWRSWLNLDNWVG